MVLSTHTISLQDQLIQKDVPALRAALPEVKFRVALLKGMSNYLCLLNLDGAARLDLLHGEEYQRLHHWAAETATGDVAELDAGVTGWASVRHTGAGGGAYERCFTGHGMTPPPPTVVNHALF